MPTCDTCEDTHRMDYRDREVPCTHCPLPCDRCARAPHGIYCAETPCSCACHPHRVETTTTQVTVVLTIEHVRNFDPARAVQAALDQSGLDGYATAGLRVKRASIGTTMYDAPVDAAGGGAP